MYVCISLAIFAQLLAECPHTLQWATPLSSQNWPFASGIWTPHLIHAPLGPPKSTSKTASWSVQQPFFHGWWSWQTDRPHRSIYNNRLHLRSTAIWPKDDICMQQMYLCQHAIPVHTVTKQHCFLGTDAHACEFVCMFSMFCLQDWSTELILRPTQHKIDHFGDVKLLITCLKSPSDSSSTSDTSNKDKLPIDMFGAIFRLFTGWLQLISCVYVHLSSMLTPSPFENCSRPPN